MSLIINCNQIFLKKGLLTIVLLGLLLSATLFISSSDLIITYMISFAFVLIMLVALFYLNRNIPEQIIIEENNLSIYYYNKAIFKKKPVSHPKKELVFDIKGNVLFLKTNSRIIAEIRKKAIKRENWKLLMDLAPGCETNE